MSDLRNRKRIGLTVSHRTAFILDELTKIDDSAAKGRLVDEAILDLLVKYSKKNDYPYRTEKYQKLLDKVFNENAE